MNEQVITLLDHYLDPGSPSHGAVMLTGPWGAGKTHFIKDYMDRRKACLTKTASDMPDSLYVSLYGVRTFEEVQAQFFAQTNPLLNSGPVRLLGALASRAINVVTNGEGLKPEDGTAVRNFLARSLKGQVLVFDDLERCVMPLGEVMGFINTFVEHDGAKVVLLACEAEIPKDEKESYFARKEKLVGKTVEVLPDAEAVYDVFVAEMRCVEAREAVRNGKAETLRTFEASGINNLRSLRSAFQDFDRLVGALDPRLGEKPDALQRLLLFIVAVTLELRSGAIVEAEVSELGMATFWSQFRKRQGDDEGDERDRLAAIVAKYPEVHWSDSVVPADLLAALFVRGVLDDDAANLVLAEHPLIVGAAATPSWRRIWRWFEIGATEYGEVRALFLEDLLHHRIVEPGPLLHSIGTLISLAENGDDLLSGEDPVVFFRRYLAQIETAGTLEPDVDPRLYMDRSNWGGLGYSNQDTEAFKAARDDLDATVLRAIESRLKARAPGLLARLKTEQAYHLLSETGRTADDYGGLAMLQNLDVTDFANLCLIDGRFNVPLIIELVQRYHQRGHKLKAEVPFVQGLMVELLRRADLEAPPRRSHLPGTIHYWFNGIYEDLGLSSPDAVAVVPPVGSDPPVA